MLCWFQVFNKVIQLCVYKYLFIFKLFSHLGYYKILSRVQHYTVANKILLQHSILRLVFLKMKEKQEYLQ